MRVLARHKWSPPDVMASEDIPANDHGGPANPPVGPCGSAQDARLCACVHADLTMLRCCVRCASFPAPSGPIGPTGPPQVTPLNTHPDKSALRLAARASRSAFVEGLDRMAHRLAFRALPSPVRSWLGGRQCVALYAQVNEEAPALRLAEALVLSLIHI